MLRSFPLLLTLAAAPALAADDTLLHGVVVQSIDLQIPDAAHHGVTAILGLNMRFSGSELVGKGNAADFAAVAKALSNDDPATSEEGHYPAAGFRVVVLLDNGVLVALLQPRKPRPIVGSEVKIEGSGRAARAVRRVEPST